ncbi:ras guanine nucleotide exchange factor domain-containing protein [Cokeromyces recurvatus]|uniref:ras guanine nucleotide exchange factor domain-containing protein n=1 Tax=Cokeromyces recurvatus TaxID=90255 RepID=UPI0022202AC5|nr:ras guanine nucleotide exchange factor domain-containing protein [Cokeromyces recurvatus]KAI7901893.1 ras guanine nucleotide exchange factor domain-containing protein [Cokeromyces recurvatus]
MEDLYSSLATASLHFNNGQIKDAYTTFLLTTQNALRPLFDVKFVHCSIISKLSHSDDLITILHLCIDSIENIIKQYSTTIPTPTKTIPPPLPPKPSHVNKLVLSPKLMTPIPAKDRAITTNSKKVHYNTKKPTSSISEYQMNMFMCQQHEDGPIPDGEINPTHLVPAQTNNNNDTLTPPPSELGTFIKRVDPIPHIPIPPLLTTHRVLQAKLDKLETALKEFHTQRNQLSQDENQMRDELDMAIAKYTPYIAEAKQTLNRVRTLYMSAATIPSILQFQPGLVAYQLTRIESAIFLAIPPHALLTHSPKNPHPRLVASSDFFNYVTRVIEHSILLPQEASSRAQHMNHWIKIASKCQELNNYQTLKAIVSALGTPPVQRLKRTWAYIPKKSITRLEAMNELMSEANNYGKYREHMGIVSTSVLNGKSVHLIQSEHYRRPTVPFLGTFIHDMTYLLAAVGQQSTPLSNHHHHHHHHTKMTIPIRTSSHNNTLSNSDPRIQKLLQMLERFQLTPPYERKPNATLSKIIMNHKSQTTRPVFSQAFQRSKTSFGRLGEAIGFGNNSQHHTTENSTHSLSGGGGGGVGDLIIHSSLQQSNHHSESSDMEEQQNLVTQYLLMRSWVNQATVDELSVIREPPSHHKHASERTSSMGSHYTSSIISNASSLILLSNNNNSSTTNSCLTLASSSLNDSSRPESLDDNHLYIYGKGSANQNEPLATSSSTLVS